LLTADRHTLGRKQAIDSPVLGVEQPNVAIAYAASAFDLGFHCVALGKGWL
jgi:hypothetical protein